MQKNALEIIEELAETPGKNDKIALIRSHEDNHTLREVFRLCYDGLITFGIKKVPEKGDSVLHGQEFMKGLTLDDALHLIESEFGGNKVSGHAAQAKLSNIIDHLPGADAEVLKRVIQRDLRCGCSGKSANKVWPGLIPEFKISKASPDFESDQMKWPVFVQLKSDGARAPSNMRGGNFQGTFSSSGRPITVSQSIKRELKRFTDLAGLHGLESLWIDGEIIATGGEIDDPLPRKQSNGLVTKAIRGSISDEELKQIHLQLWDIYDEEGGWLSSKPYHERWGILKNIFKEYPHEFGHVHPIPSFETSDPEYPQWLAAKWIKQGYEGAVVKCRDHMWKGKRTRQQQKIKDVKQADLEIVDVIEGTGKYTGMMGALRVKSADGKVACGVGTGFSDKDRAWFWEHRESVPGLIAELNYNERIKEKEQNRDNEWSLFLPVFSRLRLKEDKDHADTINEIT